MAARGIGPDAVRLRRRLNALDSSSDGAPTAGKLDPGSVEHSSCAGDILELDDPDRPGDVDRRPVSVAAQRQLERGCALGRNPGPGHLEISCFGRNVELNRNEHDSDGG